ncbi:hypothetical protein [Wolinella succinogenes]|uniref:hypothetical protein n=1 Tax=Wolinella succinogenes TaxID=844 RepID=UPI002409A713|nr:hypothetical protein [Wolinella succinogenes]
MTSGKELIVALFRDLLEAPVLDLSLVERYVSPDYVQMVDGAILDYSGFIEHLKKQKEIVKSMKVEFLALVQEGEIVFSNHVVKVEKKDGSYLEVKVIAQFTLFENRLIRCDELTRLLLGDKKDQDIGSRR